MPWRGHAGTHCKCCGRPVSECGPLSARYRCVECGEGNMRANRRDLQDHSGPFFDHWRRRCAAAVGALLIDELEADD